MTSHHPCKPRLRTILLMLFCFTAWGMLPTAAESNDSTSIVRLLNPYTGQIAPVQDKRLLYLPVGRSLARPSIPNLDEMRRRSAGGRSLTGDGLPVPGGIGSGILYKSGALQALEHAELHTKMFVYPTGWDPSFTVSWLYTPATNRMANPVELVGIYAAHQGERGVLGLFARSCSDAFPCPNGETENCWQWFKDFNDLPCNLEWIVDQGGHAQRIIQYANITRRLDDDSPPLWQNAVYLWNFCSSSWDLAYQHEYREDKPDCSVANCGWWGPIIETFDDELPEINELGFEDTLLLHDDTWSELTPGETSFQQPASPWMLAHLEANRSFGVGNYFVLAAADSDLDGLPDEWETHYGLDPADPADAAGDIDRDMLTNLREYRYDTDPTIADTDGDGFIDGWEVNYGLDPLNNDDENVDGVRDSQEVGDVSMDLDVDGTPDVFQNDMKCLATGIDDVKVALKAGDNVTAIDCLAWVDDTVIGNTQNRPAQLPIGLLSYRLQVSQPGARAVVTLYVSEPLADGVRWYKYHPDSGWRNCSGIATVSTDRRSVRLSIEDGGAWDDDGVADGLVADPSGPALVATGGSGGGGGGCFISTAGGGKH